MGFNELKIRILSGLELMKLIIMGELPWYYLFKELTFVQWLDVYDKVKYSEESELQKVFAIKIMELADNPEKLARVYQEASFGCCAEELQETAFKKILEQVTTLEQCVALCNYDQVDEGTELQKALLERILNLATTFDHWLYIYREAFPSGTWLHNLALAGVFKTATTHEQWMKIYYLTYDSATEEKVKAKMLDLGLSQEEIRKPAF